jgi:hypothetical protein
VTVPNDPLEALNWAWNHSERTWWVIGAVGVWLAWINKRLKTWKRRNALAMGPSNVPKPAAAPPPSPSSSATQSYAAAPSYSASAYAAQPAYAAPPAAAPHPAASASRKLHRDAPPAHRPAPAQRTAAPAARSVDVPAAATGAGSILGGAFGDPAHARTAMVLAEVLGPPVALR